MADVPIGQRHALVRELRPEELKFELTGLQQSEAVAIAKLMSGVVGRAHGRQMDRATRQSWTKELKSRHSKGLDAPRWLWSRVLELAPLHELARTWNDAGVTPWVIKIALALRL